MTPSVEIRSLYRLLLRHKEQWKGHDEEVTSFLLGVMRNGRLWRLASDKDLVLARRKLIETVLEGLNK